MRMSPAASMPSSIATLAAGCAAEEVAAGAECAIGAAEVAGLSAAAAAICAALTAGGLLVQ